MKREGSTDTRLPAYSIQSRSPVPTHRSRGNDLSFRAVCCHEFNFEDGYAIPRSRPRRSPAVRSVGIYDIFFRRSKHRSVMDETPIKIVEYDPDWADQFEAERRQLDRVLSEYTARIEHIGSTSVEGLSGKPIIDITAVVTDVNGLWGNLDKLSAGFGYQLSHIPTDWLFLLRTGDSGDSYNLHLIRETNDQWKNDLLFREYLRANPDVREEYATVKREAAESHPTDIDEYNAAKDDFCASVLERAKADDSIEIPDPPVGP